MLEPPEQEKLISAPPMPILLREAGLKTKHPTNRKKRVLAVIGIFVAVLGIAFATAAVVYTTLASPKTSDKSELILVTIESGAIASDIGKTLESKGIIRSQLAFDIYTRISGTRDRLQAGTYRLSPSQTVEQVVGHLLRGDVDTFQITFFPGAMLVDASDKPVNKKLDVTTVLIRAGYDKAAIDAALAKVYIHPLLVGKPDSADLEGYVYGETYNFNSGATVEQILLRTFDEMYAVVEKNDLVARYNARGLSLYQAITLASIVQGEVSTESDRRAVAAVFFNRLDVGMALGADITFVYAANKLGVAPISTLNSPYNTRINRGLPPGPIAAPGITSLLAVANPATSDFLFFVAGDDGTTHFARTNAEHEQNVARYCTVECAKP